MRISAFRVLPRSPKGGGGGGGHGGGSSGGGHGSSSGSSSSSSGSSSGKGSGSSSSSSSGKGSSSVPVVVAGGGGAGGVYGRPTYIPACAIALIVIGTIFVTLFLAALLIFCCRERRNSADKSRPFRKKRTAWKALRVAAGIALVTWLLNKFRSKKRSKNAGPYAKIEEGGDASGHSSDLYGAKSNPANAPYEHGGTGYAGYSRDLSLEGGVGGKYEPMSYAGTTSGSSASHPDVGYSASSRFTQPEITGPIEQTSTVPLPLPSPSPAPSMVSDMTAPPPYAGRAVSDGVYKPPAPEDSAHVQVPPPVSYTRY